VAREPLSGAYVTPRHPLRRSFSRTSASRASERVPEGIVHVIPSFASIRRSVKARIHRRSTMVVRSKNSTWSMRYVLL